MVAKKTRGILKGLKVVKKAAESKSGKLHVLFSKTYGGSAGINHRSFMDEVVLQMRRHAPIVNVRRWAEIPVEVKNIIKDKVLERWDLINDEDTKKIFDICKERYQGWSG